MGDRRDRFFKRTLRTPKQDFEEVHIGKPKEDSVDFSFVMGQQLKFNVHCIFFTPRKTPKGSGMSGSVDGLLVLDRLGSNIARLWQLCGA